MSADFRYITHTLSCFAPVVFLLSLPRVAPAEDQFAPVTALASNAEGDALVAGSRNGIQVYRLPSLELRRSLKPLLEIVHDVVFSPDGSSLSVSGGVPGESGEVFCLAWPSLKLRWRQAVAEDVVYAADYSPDGQIIALAAHDSHIRLLRAADGKLLGTLSGHSKPVRDVCFLNTDLMVSAGIDMSIRVWKTDGWTVRRTLRNHRQSVQSLSLSPAEGQPLLASGSVDRTVRFWQPAIGRMVRFYRLPSPVTVTAFDRTGERLLAACQNGAVWLIDVATLESIQLRPPAVWIHSLQVIGDTCITGDADGHVKKLKIP